VLVTVGFDPVEYEPRLWNTDPHRAVIHLDEIPADVDNHYQPTVELRGDIAATLIELTRPLSGLRLSDEETPPAESEPDSVDGLTRHHLRERLTRLDGHVL